MMGPEVHMSIPVSIEASVPSAEEPAEFTVGQVAELSGTSSSAVRFYEKHGLIHSERTSGNQRRYRSDVSCRIRMIRVAQRIGMSVAEIGDALRLLPEDRRPDFADWGRLSAHLRAEVAIRINQLEQVLTEMEGGDKLCELPGVSAEDRPTRRRVS
jgi:MerR family redox-sensitive transcriptional activator SoxR